MAAEAVESTKGRSRGDSPPRGAGWAQSSPEGVDHRGPRRPAILVAALLGAALLFASFIALGVWQVQRLGWKQDLIARLEQRLAAVPVAAPGPDAWPTITKTSDEYRRITLRGTFDHARATRVQASTVLGTGYWVLTPLRTEAGWWVLVNRGFVPPGTPGDEPTGPQTVTGLLRLTEPDGSLLQHNDVAAGRWYSRDVAAIAVARGLTEAAPYFVDAAAAPSDTAPDTAAWPRPGLTVLHFSNNHLVYALTWFALAAMVATAAWWLLRDARQPA